MFLLSSLSISQCILIHYHFFKHCYHSSKSSNNYHHHYSPSLLNIIINSITETSLPPPWHLITIFMKTKPGFHHLCFYKRKPRSSIPPAGQAAASLLFYIMNSPTLLLPFISKENIFPMEGINTKSTPEFPCRLERKKNLFSQLILIIQRRNNC